jgi:tRNA(Arg) A34 adenosine deaminase TadA
MVTITAETPPAQLPSDAETLDQLLTIIEKDVLPKTRIGVSNGNKFFGAAVMKYKGGVGASTDCSCKHKDLELLMAETNNEMECPLYHGEVHLIKKWTEAQKAFSEDSDNKPPNPKDCVFLATHQPCCLCVSAIVWAGYTRLYYLFSYEDSKTAYGIPHDLDIMHQLWGVKNYVEQNKFLNSGAMKDMIDALDDADMKASLQKRVTGIEEEYTRLAGQYHKEKANNKSNTLAFD